MEDLVFLKKIPVVSSLVSKLKMDFDQKGLIWYVSP